MRSIVRRTDPYQTTPRLNVYSVTGKPRGTVHFAYSSRKKNLTRNSSHAKAAKAVNKSFEVVWVRSFVRRTDPQQPTSRLNVYSKYGKPRGTWIFVYSENKFSVQLYKNAIQPNTLPQFSHANVKRHPNMYQIIWNTERYRGSIVRRTDPWSKYSQVKWNTLQDITNQS